MNCYFKRLNCQPKNYAQFHACDKSVAPLDHRETIFAPAVLKLVEFAVG